MTCDEFKHFDTAETYLNATRAERAAVQHHSRVCTECAKLIARSDTPSGCANNLLRRLAATWEIDCLDPEFVSVAFASRVHKAK